MADREPPRTIGTDKVRERARQATTGSGGGTVDRRPDHPVQQLLERYTGSLAELLPKGMDVARFKRTAWLTVRDDPKLLGCDPASIVAGVFRAGQLGLEVGGTLGQCYLIPFRDKERGIVVAQFVLGYKGLVVLAHRSARVLDITGRVVREGDLFDYGYGTDEHITHKPVGDPDAPLTHVYAIARYVNGGRNLEVLTRGQVDTYRARSKAAGSGPWVTDYDQMSLKTAVRRLQPFLPLAVEDAALLDPAGDERVYDLADHGGRVDVIPAPDPEVETVETVRTEVGIPPEPDPGDTEDVEGAATEGEAGTAPSAPTP